MSLTAIAITFVLSYVFLYVLGQAIGLQRLLRLVLPNPSITRIDADALSQNEADVFATTHDWLLGHDFRLAASFHLNPHFRSPTSLPRAARYYLNAGNTVVALLTVSVQPGSGPCSLVFLSRNAKNETLQTSNRSLASNFPAAPGRIHQDGYLDSHEAQLFLHRKTLSVFEPLACDNIDEITAWGRANDEATLDFWAASGWITRHPEDYRLTLKGAWTLLRRARVQSKRLRTLPPMSEPVSASASSASAQSFVRDVITVTRPGNTKGSRWKKSLIFLGTLALFLVLGNFQWNLTTVVALLLVLFIHELGHFLAMLAFGYRDLSIFFLPLLGAATSGRHDHAGPWQKLIVFLAGPVPGILLALLVLWLLPLGLLPSALSPGNPAFLTFITLLLVINYLNLLPVTPFDGGRVMEILFFSRYPRANFFFYAACVAAFVLAWYFTQDHVLLVLSIVLGIGLPGQWRIAQAARVLRPEFGRHADENSAIQTLADTLARPEFRSLPAASRSLMVQMLLPRLQQVVTPWRTSLAGGLLYMALLGAPLLLLLPGLSYSRMLPGLGHMVSSYSLDEYRKELEKTAKDARTPLQKVGAYRELAEYLSITGGDDTDPDYFRYALLAYQNITPELDSSVEAADARTTYAGSLEMKGESEKVLPLYVEAYEKLRQSHPDEHDRLANMLEQQARLLPETATAREKIALLQAAHDQYSKSENIYGRFSAGDKLALAWHQQGNDAAAEPVLRSLLQSSTAEDDDYDYLRRRTTEALAWLLLGAGRQGEAITLLQSLPDTDKASHDISRSIAWAQLEAGQPDAAHGTLYAALEKHMTAGKLRHNHEKENMALYLLDDVLVYQKQKDENGKLTAQKRFSAFLDEHKLNGNHLAANIAYSPLPGWSQALQDAEAALLKEMGFSDTTQCEPAADSKPGKPASTST